MVAEGHVARSETGRVTWPDGTNILRRGNETIVSAVNNELSFRAHKNMDRPVPTSAKERGSSARVGVTMGSRTPHTRDVTYAEQSAQAELEEMRDVTIEADPVIRQEKGERQDGRKTRCDGVLPPSCPTKTLKVYDEHAPTTVEKNTSFPTQNTTPPTVTQNAPIVMSISTPIPAATTTNDTTSSTNEQSKTDSTAEEIADTVSSLTLTTPTEAKTFNAFSVSPITTTQIASDMTRITRKLTLQEVTAAGSGWFWEENETDEAEQTPAPQLWNVEDYG